MIDAVELSQSLIRCPSVTPQDEGALDILETTLKSLGFKCHRLPFGDIDNLYASIGTGGLNFCFAGHTDVVPPGDVDLWRSKPFAAEIRGGTLYGRGAADMKSAIAAFVAAAERMLAKGAPHGTISLLITGDEEGLAVNGTKKVLEWLAARGERIDHCVVGEPGSVAHAADVIKHGRRGSMNFRVTVSGMQGHSAYPQNALNPLPTMAKLVTSLSETPLDNGTDHFEPSTLQFTSIDVGNPATNVIPAVAHGRFNIRFNDLHTPETLLRRIETVAEEIARESGCEIAVEGSASGVAFLTKPGPFTELLRDAAEKITGTRPRYSTGGGTSDARFIKDYCPVAEMGLPGTTMHKTDECVPVAEIHRLVDIYATALELYFAKPLPG